MGRQIREAWVDRVKLLACILVASGHFYQSMVTSGILRSGSLYVWFNRTIYYFHVPLFFICSGYLYQKTARVGSFVQWRGNIIKRAVTLGIPYVVFSLITWGLKNLFSNAVNYESLGLFETLLTAPVSPYWFLYTLFFVFFNHAHQCFLSNGGLDAIDSSRNEADWYVPAGYGNLCD